MSVWTVVMLAAVSTYGVRAAALLLPELPSGRVQDVVARVPAPLFGGLALATLLRGSADGVPPVPMLVAAGAAAVVAPRRSLGLTLVAGASGYLVASWLVPVGSA